MLLTVVSAFAALMIAFFALFVPSQTLLNQTTLADVEAANFWSYQQSVSSYVYNHPGTNGTVPDASLTWQLGYKRNPAWTNIVSSGTLYTYSTSSLPPGAIAAIAKRGNYSLMLGVSNNGTMNSINNVAQGYALPAAIPTGVIVMIGT